jgi:hypothetical protein
MLFEQLSSPVNDGWVFLASSQGKFINSYVAVWGNTTRSAMSLCPTMIEEINYAESVTVWEQAQLVPPR